MKNFKVKILLVALAVITIASVSIYNYVNIQNERNEAVGIKTVNIKSYNLTGEIELNFTIETESLDLGILLNELDDEYVFELTGNREDTFGRILRTVGTTIADYTIDGSWWTITSDTHVKCIGSPSGFADSSENVCSDGVDFITLNKEVHNFEFHKKS